LKAFSSAKQLKIYHCKIPPELKSLSLSPDFGGPSWIVHFAASWQSRKLSTTPKTNSERHPRGIEVDEEQRLNTVSVSSESAIENS
jgi:hypothetical protein